MDTKAKESDQVKRARQKLKKQLEKEKQLFNPKILDEMDKSIRQWLMRHKEERINIRDKTIKLFDENRHSAKVKSVFIRHLSDKLAKAIKGIPQKPKEIGGRIIIVDEQSSG